MNSQATSLDSIYGSGGGDYLKAKNLPEGDRPFLWIKSADVVTKTFKDSEGPKSSIELTFFPQEGNDYSKMKWTLNRTQAQELERMYGPFQNGGWIFKGIRIYRGQTKFQGEVKPTISLYPDTYEMTPEQVAGAQQYLQAERAAAAAAAQEPQFSGPPQQQQGFGAPQSSQPIQQQSPGFAPPPAGNDPTKNW
jgi:hypothetical protein